MRPGSGGVDPHDSREGTLRRRKRDTPSPLVSGVRGEEKTFWARVLTFGDIHTLIAKAEHSQRVLHETLEDLGQHEMDLRAELRLTEERESRR